MIWMMIKEIKLSLRYLRVLLKKNNSKVYFQIEVNKNLNNKLGHLMLKLKTITKIYQIIKNKKIYNKLILMNKYLHHRINQK